MRDVVGPDIWALRNANERRWPDRDWSRDDRCVLCARVVGPAEDNVIEVSIEGEWIRPGDPRSDDDTASQGWWTIGSTCLAQLEQEWLKSQAPAAED